MSVGSKAGIVGDDPEALPAVTGADRLSRNIERLDAVADALQVSADEFECHAGEVSNVLTADPSGPAFEDDAQHLRPEVSVVIRAAPLAGGAEGLTGEAPGEEVNVSPEVACIETPDVPVNRHVRPVPAQDAPAEIIPLHELSGLEARPAGGQREPADAAEQIYVNGRTRGGIQAFLKE